MTAIRKTLSVIVAGLLVYSVFPCSVKAQPERKPGNIFDEQEPNMGRGMRGHDEPPGGGPPPDGRRGMRGPWELSDDIIDRIMKSIEKTNPEKAKELAELRKSDPNKFRQDLREYGRDELAKIFREQMDSGRRRWQTEYLDWLEKNYSDEAKDLTKYKERGPEEYMKRFDLSISKYGDIFRASKENPELAVVLKEDLELKGKRDELLTKIKAAKNEDERKELVSQLKEVISNRFDLIVRQKEIAYERLLKRLEELKQQISNSKDEITKWKDSKFKEGKVDEHIKDLTEGLLKFRWN